MQQLKGITWDHARGYAPMLATTAAYARIHPGVDILWERRSLRAFGDQPVEPLAAKYDLIVLDHPHCGTAARTGCLVALDEVGRDDALATLARQSIGGSHESYTYDGHQWALALDAAVHVAAYRADWVDRPPTAWHEVVALAKAGMVMWPLEPVNALMSFFTLAANRGTPCAGAGRHPMSRADIRARLAAMREVSQHLTPECLGMDPIAVLERMATDDAVAYCPLLFGYCNYARPGFRKRTIRFTNIPTVGRDGPGGAILGGAGIAVSSRCRAPEIAVDYAFWISSAACQRTLYFESGGQPANAAAWDDDDVNGACDDFFRRVRPTMDRAYTRPRHDGYPAFQREGGRLVHAFLSGELDADRAAMALEDRYRKSLGTALNRGATGSLPARALADKPPVARRTRATGIGS